MLGALGGLGLLAACSGPASPKPGPTSVPAGATPPARTASGRLTVQDWTRSRGAPFYIAHRGIGDIYPEHSMPSYRAAVEAGAQCLEVSVNATSDGVLICMHDTTYDRTTNGTGLIAAQPSSVLAKIGIRQPQLGPAWVQPPLTPIPRLESVLAEFGGKVVLCLEAKDDNAYPAMMKLVTQHGLLDSVIVKAYFTSNRIPEAKAAGLPVFSYLSPADMTEQTIAKAAGRLEASDYLVLPCDNGDYVTYYPPALISAAKAHSVPLMVYPIHRRADAAYYFGLGVSGAVTSDYRYTTTNTASATSDDWASKRISSGEKPKMPDSKSLAGAWTSLNELTLGAEGDRQFLTLGQLCPVASAASQYRVKFSASWNRLPRDLTSTVSLACCHVDDRYYEDGLSLSEGYHVTMSPDGALKVYRHSASAPEQLLGQVSTPAVSAGQWVTLQLDVSPRSLIWTRTDMPVASPLVVHDSAVRGGYLAIGRSGAEAAAAVSLREFSVG
jgi:glycerophosphoryl diester phosphodiesterase